MQSHARFSSMNKNLESQAIQKNFERRVHRLAANFTRTNSSDTNKAIADAKSKISNNALSLEQYLPVFKGIYVFTETTNTQTRLFDYTSILDDNERVQTFDADKDGDKDFLYEL